MFTMRNYKFAMLLGITSTVAFVAPSPVEAATFNFDDLQFLTSKPLDFTYSLDFLGRPSDNLGTSGFFNLDPSAADVGHADISLNATGNGAPYYVTGRQASPEEPFSGAPRTADLTGITGFPTLSSLFIDNTIDFSNLGFGFGQKSDRSFTTTWNLGEDIQGQDWFGTPDSTIEERIYRANSNDVELFLSFGTTTIISFGYSDLFVALDYGPTPALGDDIDVAYTNPIKATKVTGLNLFEDALANAFLQDVAVGGGRVQLVLEDNQVDEDVSFGIGNGFGVFNLRFVGSLRVVTVPESSSTLGLLMLGALGTASYLKKQQKAKKNLI
ncbi:hypothetical protein [Anabaena cylindrica]|nr:hypothetical protein [Anabaena cylindrica]